jgi:hypothetical protein
MTNETDAGTQKVRRLADIADLKTVLELDSGDRWIEIDSDAAAGTCGVLTQTAIERFYLQEAKLEGGHPRRWFALVGPADTGAVIGKVCLCVLPEGVESADPNWIATCHTTGYRNLSPYPEFAQEIEELAIHTDLTLEPNCMGRPYTPDAAPKATRPKI